MYRPDLRYIGNSHAIMICNQISQKLLLIVCVLAIFTKAHAQQDYSQWQMWIDDATAMRDLSMLQDLYLKIGSEWKQRDPDFFAKVTWKISADLSSMGHPERQAEADALSRRFAVDALSLSDRISFATESKLVSLVTSPVDDMGRHLHGEAWVKYRGDQIRLWLHPWHRGYLLLDPDWKSDEAISIAGPDDFPSGLSPDQFVDPKMRQEQRINLENLKREQKQLESYFAQRQLREDLARFSTQAESHLTSLCDTPPFHSDQFHIEFERQKLNQKVRSRLLRLPPVKEAGGSNVEKTK